MDELDKLLQRIVYEKSPSGMYFAYIPNIENISSYSDSKENCRKELKDILAEWLKAKKTT